ncbi:MAG: acyl carrier protein [Lachnospiraceae bacterium]
MEKLLEILQELKSGIDYETEKGLIDKELFDSFDILSIVGELEDEFGVEVTPVDIVPSNFNSAEALWNMVQRLQQEA